jgi:hypothetical protein
LGNIQNLNKISHFEECLEKIFSLTIFCVKKVNFTLESRFLFENDNGILGFENIEGNIRKEVFGINIIQSNGKFSEYFNKI